MRHIKLTIAYDGADFHGWQYQPALPTIQGLVAGAAGKITQEETFIHGASRTDAGVHALGQVAHFTTQSGLTAEDFRRGMNAFLPPQIRIVAAEEVGPDFHARWQALGKKYCYRIFRGLILPPFEYRRVLHHPWPLDEAAMQEAARQFEGLHDFSSFAASPDDEDGERDRETVREIFRSEIVRRPYAPFGIGAGLCGAQGSAAAGSENSLAHELHFIVRGKSFLRYMVRKIVGTLIEVGKGKLNPADIAAIFDAKDRTRSGPTVPPDGLYLISLDYPDPTDSLAAGRQSRNRKAAVPGATIG